MRDQYAGDVSDFLKFGLLRTLAKTDRVLGIAWYFVPGHDGRTDGRHTEWRDDPAWKLLDAQVYSALSTLPEPSVAALERSAIWPKGVLFHREPVPVRAQRNAWAERMRTALDKADIVFLDPDNGLGKETKKYATPREVRLLRQPGRAVVLITFPAWNVRHDVQLDRLRKRLCSEAGVENMRRLLTKLFLQVPDSPLLSVHSTYLAPYYSASSSQGLSAKIVELVNAVSTSAPDDPSARQVIENINEWSDGLYETEKDILLEAISKRSHFTIDIIGWISRMTTALLAVSNAPPCDEHTQRELQRNALWLISVLSFVPEDQETVSFIESFQMTETLFESAVDARQRDCLEVSDGIRDLLLAWAFKGGKYHTGWAILERAIYGLAILVLLAEEEEAIAKLKADIQHRLDAGGLPDQTVRERAAREMRRRANELYRQGHWFSAIEQGMAQVDHEKLQPLLQELATLISPDRAGEV